MLPHRNTGRKPADREQGLSEVIGFVLILGLIVIFITLWMTYVVPAEGRENEIRHMNDVRDWFTQYKITLDSLWINSMNTDLTFPTISNSLTLGSQGGATQAGGFYLPLMKPIGSTGGIAVVNYDERIRILIDNDEKADLNIGALEFRASNHYWIPQTYYYQMGGVFLQQEGGTVARVAPLIDLKNLNGTHIGLDITLVNISGGGLVSISGQGPVRVDTRMDSASRTESYFETNMSVILNLRNESTAIAWENVLKEIRYSRGIPQPPNSTMNCTIFRDNSTVTMNIRSFPVQSKATIYYPANYTVSLQSIATGVT